MTWFRMPLFCWAIYATSVIQVLATPVLAITLLLLCLERVLGVGIFDPQLGGEQARVKAGDEVLWALVPYPYPEELMLRTPGTVKVGKPFAVTVTGYDDAGKRHLIKGATVTGASEPTGANGKTTITVNAVRPLILRARRGADIPSRPASVCVRGTGVTACS